MLDEFARLKAMLRRRGTALPHRPDADAWAALERCRNCNCVKLCDEHLATPVSNLPRTFCINSHYIEARREKCQYLVRIP